MVWGDVDELNGGLTKIFFSATNTLGVETTATVMSAVAPSSSWFA
jgi:hypothetical protein